MASKKTPPASSNPAPKAAKAAKAKSGSGPAKDEPAELVGAQAHYEHFLPLTKTLDARDVRPFRADASLALHNAQTGVLALLSREAQVKAELPTVKLGGVRGLPDLALAVGFAAAQVDTKGVSSGRIAELMPRAQALRELLLASAKALAVAGLVPKREVEKIIEGRGSIDMAQDNIDLAALFTKHAAAVKGKTAVTADQIKEAAAAGTELLTLLKRKDVKRDRKAKGDVKSAVELRDRMWTLLVQQYDVVRRAGMWIWGDAVDEHVPLLQSRAASPSRKTAKKKGGTGTGDQGAPPGG